MRLKLVAAAAAVCLPLLGAGVATQASAAPFTLEQILSYPFIAEVTSPEHRDRIAWISDVRGVRNVWVADGPEFRPRQVTRYAKDDGQELSQLTFSPDGTHLVYVRGGDHDANWPDKGGIEPDPDLSTTKPVVTIWSVALDGGEPRKVAEGDAPAISARNVLAYVAGGQVWTARVDGYADEKDKDKAASDKAKADAGKDAKADDKPKQMFFDRGHAGQLAWSPDGTRLAFVSGRGDHAFIGVFADGAEEVAYMQPSTGLDGMPVWSPDGKRIAYVRRPGQGGALDPILVQTPSPWSIWTADVATGTGTRVWASPKTLAGSYPDVDGEANLHWMASDTLTFMAEMDNWPHLYSVPAAGGEAKLLTPGPYQIEHVSQTPDRKALLYAANDPIGPADGERRHIFRLAADGSAPTPLTHGEAVDWRPVAADPSHVAFIGAGPQQPPMVELVGANGEGRRAIDPSAVPPDFPMHQLVTPKPVTFTAADGVVAHGQLFEAPGGAAKKPAVIFVHGGPPRQMLLGWHYMDYYSNAYAENQYLASRGFVVLSVNYRLGIGYGFKFQHPDHAGYAGGAEYQDVVAGAKFLQHRPSVDAARIGIWGGSYGGYLTAMGLSRNSDIFKAGVDLHGVHDWSKSLGEFLDNPNARYEQGDRAAAMAVAFKASPDADIATWRSPVLLIQGDDDRNVHFSETIDLANRLDKQGVEYRELVLPNEIHGFLRFGSWLKADGATADYLAEKLGAR